MAKKKLKRYKKLIISHDCLVPKGAMEVESVFKEVDGATEFTKLKTKPVFKFDDSEQMIYNVMVKWNDPDSEDWILDDANVRRDAMIDYQANGDKVLKFTHQKDDNDKPYDIDAHVVETYIVKENDPIFPDYIGSIARSAYFADAEEYSIIKELEFESSIEGKAMLEDFEVEDETIKEKTNKAIHKIKDLLKNTFKFEDGKLTKKSFLTILEDVTKNFDSVIEDRKNTDVYFATTALQIAIEDAEWSYLYGGEKNIDGFKKEVGKTIKQFKKYIDEMTFEVVTKDNDPKNKQGEESMEQAEVQKMIDDSLTKTLGLEEGQTLADLIKKTASENPPKLAVKGKDKDGKEIEISLVDAVGTLATEFSAMKADNTAKFKEMEEGITANKENKINIPEKAEPVEKSDTKRKAEMAL